MYMRRRLQHLFDELRSGRLVIAPSLPPKLVQEIAALQVDEAGNVLLSSAGQEVRALARAVFGTQAMFDEPQPRKRPIDGLEKATDLHSLQVSLFEHLEAVIRAFIGGGCVDDFAAPGERFEVAYERLLHEWTGWSPQRKSAAQEALISATSRLSSFYNAHAQDMFGLSRRLPGQKLVLGGQRFNSRSLAAVQQLALYADTIMIPDPVAPWFETERTHEKARLPRVIEQIFYLRKIRELVVSVPGCMVVFPSFEKRLERDDPVTQEGIEKAFLVAVNAALSIRAEDEEEIFAYARNRPDDFLTAIDRAGLFVPPGNDGTGSLRERIEALKFYITENRSPEYLASRPPDSMLVALHIYERITPAYHVEENSRELGGTPLLAHHQHWHYFRLLQDAKATQDTATSTETKQALRTLQALTDDRLSWLGNVPIPALVALRQDGANLDFRRRLTAALGQIEAAPDDSYGAEVEHVAAGLRVLLLEHDREVRKLEDDYRLRYKKLLAGTTVGGAVASLLVSAAQFLPWLPDLTLLTGGATVSALALGGKYLAEKAEERHTKQRMRRTLMGYLAAARASGESHLSRR